MGSQDRRKDVIKVSNKLRPQDLQKAEVTSIQVIKMGKILIQVKKVN